MGKESGTIEVRYVSTQPLFLDAWEAADPSLAVAHWGIEVVRVNDEDQTSRTIGGAVVAICDLTKDIDWFDVGDAEGGDLYQTCISLLFTPAGELPPELDDGDYCDRLLLLDHMTLDEGERGEGLGPTVRG